MLLELHAHTSKHSVCSKINPLELIKQAKAKQLQGLVITEHHYLWGAEELEALRKDAEVEESFVILSAQEVESDIGHIVVFGAEHTLPQMPSPYKLKDIRDKYPQSAIILAHPYRNGKKPSKESLLNPLIDAVEIFNTNQTLSENYAGLSDWHKYKFTAVSGSDTHRLETAAVFPTQFDHPVFSINELIEEIKNGRCRPFFKEIPKSGSNLAVTEITIGTKGDDEVRNRLIVKKFTSLQKWQKAKKMTAVPEMLYKNGFSTGTYRIPKILNINDSEMTIIEESQRGKSLFELLKQVNPVTGAQYYNLAAKWLAKLHEVKHTAGSPKEFEAKEVKRFDSYLKNFMNTSNPYTPIAEAAINKLKKFETAIFKDSRSFARCHGDYHPKNIIIGQDKMHDLTTLYVSVIDFDSSMFFTRAFDVGYFCAQFKAQYRAFPDVANNYNENEFIKTYLEESKLSSKNFKEEVELFKIRAYLSIASFLIKVGKGESLEMDAIIHEFKNF